MDKKIHHVILEKAGPGIYTRTRLGKQETVHYQPKKKWIVTHADGSTTPVEAGSRWEVVQKIKEGGHKPAITIDEVGEVKKSSGITCPYDGLNGIQLRRYKQDAVWIREFRCPRGHVWQTVQ